jgi:hypothetical protein
VVKGGGKSIWEVVFNVGGKADPTLNSAFGAARKQIAALKDSTKRLGQDWKTFAGNASKLALGVVGAVGGVTAAMVGMANSVVDAADEAGTAAAQMNIGFEAYQELKYALEQLNVETSTYSTAIEYMTRVTRQGAAGNESYRKALADVGLSADKLSKMAPEKALERVADYMKSLPGDAERTRVAIALFGKSAGLEMMGALKDGSGAMKEYMEQARRTGTVIDESTGQAADAYENNQRELMASVNGIKTQFISGAIGPLAEAFNVLSGEIQGNLPAIRELGEDFGKWLGDVVRKLPDVIEKISKFGTELWDKVVMVKDFLGGWKNVALVVGGLAVAPTFISGLKVVGGLFKVIKTAVSPLGSLIGGIFGKAGAAGKAAGDMAAAGKTAGGTGGGMFSGLKSLAKNLAMGLVIIAEVAAAALLITGAITLLGKGLEQAGIAWKPVIDNGASVAIAMGLGTAILAAIGVLTAALGSVGTPLIVNIALGIAILAEIGIAAGLFIAEIWLIGEGLGKIRQAWEPVLANGETIAQAIGLGTALLIGIGVVTAALGVAAVASAGLLPLAIGLGTAILVELAAAFIIFTESLAAVAGQLSNSLAPALNELNGKLPALSQNMSDFVAFMEIFAGHVVAYSKASAISGLASTVDTIIGWFTKDPIEKLTDDIGKNYKQFAGLTEKLNPAVPEMQKARDMLQSYTNLMGEIEALVSNQSAVSLKGAFSLDMKGLGINIVTGLDEGVKSKSSLFTEIGSRFTSWWSDVEDWWKLNPASAVAEEAGQGIAQGLINSIAINENPWTPLPGWFDASVIAPVTAASDTAATDIVSYFTTALKDIKSVWGGMKPWFKGSVASPIEDVFEKSIRNITNYFRDLAVEIKNGVSGALDSLKGLKEARSGGSVYDAPPKVTPISLPAHAEGGIFNVRHIAEIAEKGAEAVVPLDRSAGGRRIWEQAGIIGGYSQETSKIINMPVKQAGETARNYTDVRGKTPFPATVIKFQAVTRSSEEKKTAPPAAIAQGLFRRHGEGAAERISIQYSPQFYFNNKPDAETLQRVAESGNAAAKAFEDELEDYYKRRRRAAY